MDNKRVLTDVSNVEVLLTRMEGKIDLLAQAHAHRDEHMRDLREQVAKFTDTLQSVQSLNLPEQLRVIDQRLATHSDRLDVHDTDLAQRQGAMSTVRVVWGLAGAAIATVLTILGMIFKGVGS